MSFCAVVETDIVHYVCPIHRFQVTIPDITRPIAGGDRCGGSSPR